MLDEFKKDHQMFHSELQIKDFILLKNGKTKYGVYKQAVRELLGRESSLRGLYASKAKLDIEREEIAHKISLIEGKEEERFNLRRLRITQAECDYTYKDLERTIADTQREFSIFYNVACNLKNELGEIDEKRRELLDREYWLTSTKLAIVNDIRITGRVQGDTMKMVESFHLDTKLLLWDFINQSKDPEGFQRMLKWEHSIKSFNLDTSAPTLETVEIKKLVEGK